MPKRVALYARVSTREQRVDPQLYALRAYAAARGLEIAGEFVDPGVSGARDRRPACGVRKSSSIRATPAPANPSPLLRLY